MAEGFSRKDIERVPPGPARDAMEREWAEYQQAQREEDRALRNAATSSNANERKRYEADAKAAERKASAAIRQIEAEIRQAEREAQLRQAREDREFERKMQREREQADRAALKATQEAEEEERRRQEAYQHDLAEIEARAQAAERAAAARADAKERELAAREAAIQRAEIRKQEQARAKAAAARSKAIRNAGKSTSLLSTSKDTRFMDAGITALASAVTVVYTATRPGNQSLGFAAFWMLAGALAMVEGTGGELQYLGGGILSANGAYFALRLFDLVKVEPAVNTTPIPGTGNTITG